MIFKFLEKPLVLDCFVAQENYLRIAPIQKATNHYPDWWKELPKFIEQNSREISTMKLCYGFLDLYKSAVALPLWSDLFVEVLENKNYSWCFADVNAIGMIHPQQQMGGFAPLDKYGHLKLFSPWLFYTNIDVKWAWIPATYNQKDFMKVQVLPGVTNFYDMHDTNVNVLIDITAPKKIVLQANTPMAYLVPLTERKIVVNRHLISEQEYKNRRTAHSPLVFTNHYGQQRKNGQCPFTNHTK